MVPLALILIGYQVVVGEGGGGRGTTTHSLSLLGLMLQERFSLPCTVKVNLEVKVGVVSYQTQSQCSTI